MSSIVNTHDKQVKQLEQAKLGLKKAQRQSKKQRSASGPPRPSSTLFAPDIDEVMDVADYSEEEVSLEVDPNFPNAGNRGAERVKSPSVHFALSVGTSTGASSVDWTAIRSHLIGNASPFFRFRALRSLEARQSYSHEISLHSAQVVVVIVRAIGENHATLDKNDKGLKAAFGSLKIVPVVIHRLDHVEWINEWVVQIQCDQVSILPAFNTLNTKGIFCGANGSRMYNFIWSLAPGEVDRSHSYFSEGHLRMQLALTPLYALQPDSLPDLRGACVVNGGNGLDHQLEVRSVQHMADQINGQTVLTGRFIVNLSDHPKGVAADRLWNGAGTKFLPMKWGLANVSKLTLLPACSVCGFEFHEGGGCAYSGALASVGRLNKQLANTGTTDAFKYKNTLVFTQPAQSHPGPHVAKKIQPKIKGKGKGKAKS